MSIVTDYLDGLGQGLRELSGPDIEAVADIIMVAWRQQRRVFVMGNGGSAATASHFARDLQIGAAAAGKPRVRAVSLADSIVNITALANDIEYGAVFVEQLIGQLEAGDVVIGISASGNSPNVLRAIEYARREGAVTVGLVGFGGGKLKDMVDKYVVLSSRDYGPVEDLHLVLAHMLAYLVREKIKRS